LDDTLSQLHLITVIQTKLELSLIGKSSLPFMPALSQEIRISIFWQRDITLESFGQASQQQHHALLHIIGIMC